jgi:phage repressor protein C with HTH and peptisase S24 domain
MLPAFRPGRLVVGVSDPGELYPGQVVIIRHGGLEKVKRIQRIKQNQIFVVGDNQERSTDSRSFGWLHRSVVVGRVIWPKR